MSTYGHGCQPGQRPEQTVNGRAQPVRACSRERANNERSGGAGFGRAGIDRPRAFRRGGRNRNRLWGGHRCNRGRLRCRLSDGQSQRGRRPRLGSGCRRTVDARCGRRRRYRRHRDGRRLSCRRLGRRRGLGRSRARRQQRQRVDVPVLVGGDADPEVDVRRLGDAVAALPYLPDRLALSDARTLLERHPLELQQGDGVAVLRANRDGMTAVRDAPDERHSPGGGRANDAADVGRDVDAPVLATCIRVVAERERAQDRTVDGPAPRERSGSEHECEQGQTRDQPSHCHLRSLRLRPRRPR